jgi:virginiamycin B lyase
VRLFLNKRIAVLAVAVIVLLAVSGIVVVYYSGVFHTGSNTSTKTTAQIIGNTSPLVKDPFMTEYTLPSAESLPNAIAVDSNENVWTVIQNDSSLGKFIPSTGSFVEYHLPGLKAGAALTSWGIAIDNSDHTVWFTDEVSNAVWSFNTTSETFIEHSIKTPAALPYQVSIDSQGNVWFTEFSGDKIGVVSQNGTINEFPIPIAPSQPTGIAVDIQTNRVWFNLLETSGSVDQFYVGSFYNGSFTFNNITPEVDTPVGIAVGQNGTLWLTQHGASLVSEFNPTTRFFRTISTSIPPVGASYPYFVYVDQATGNVWFNEHYGNAISVFNPKDNVLTEYEIPSRNVADGNISGALTMTVASNGIPWFTELYNGKLGNVNTSSPVGLSLRVSGDNTIQLSNLSSTQLQFSISDNTQEQVSLSASVGNFTGQFQFNFTKYTGVGNYSTTLTVTNGGSPPGIYFATLSAETQNVIVSQIIEIRCS